MGQQYMQLNCLSHINLSSSISELFPLLRNLPIIRIKIRPENGQQTNTVNRIYIPVVKFQLGKHYKSNNIINVFYRECYRLIN